MSDIPNIEFDKEEDEMSDYIFRRYEEYRDKCEVLEKELAALRRDKDDSTESGMLSDMQTKLLIAAIADILSTAQDLTEANERFMSVANSAGITFDGDGRRAHPTRHGKQRFPALDASIEIDGDTVTVASDDGSIFPLGKDEWERFRTDLRFDDSVNYDEGETPMTAHQFRTCVEMYRQLKSLETEREHLESEIEQKKAKLEKK